MSRARERALKDAAQLFFALGDDTRLSLVRKLGERPSSSATALSEDAHVSRQAISKHLRVLEGAGLVRHERHGREVLYFLEGSRFEDARAYLDGISARWDKRLERLRRLVEDEQGRAFDARAADK